MAVHRPSGTGKSTVFPLALAHWDYTYSTGNKPGLTVCSQPGRILAQSVCAKIEDDGLIPEADL